MLSTSTVTIVPAARASRASRAQARGVEESRLGVERRVGGDDDEVVYGVEAEADGVELSLSRRLEGESHGSSRSGALRNVATSSAKCSNFPAKGETPRRPRRTRRLFGPRTFVG